ncbi:MAG TPA: DUF2269 family protein [Acidimicrobiales bacterium]|nr:DUF2269 family protein [Acidimicrobiales bacterium]
MPDSDPFYDVVVVVHIVGSVAGFGALACTGVFAAVARRGKTSNGEAIRRYFNGRTNWLARTVYSVPILGLVLLAMSDGAFRFDEAWIVASVVLWVLAVALAELVIWPGERFISVAAEGLTSEKVDPSLRARTGQVCLRVVMATATCVVVFAASLVIMLVKPGR